jgi:S1-C subfamily serine protease
MKTSLIALVALSLVGCGARDKYLRGAAGEKGEKGDPGDYTASINALLLKVRTYKESILDVECNNNMRGTGALVTGGEILTAHHVTENSTSCKFFSGGGYVGESETITQQGNRDIVFIKPVEPLPHSLHKISYVQGYNPRVGELLLAMTHPEFLNYHVQYTFGNIAGEAMTDAEIGNATGYWNGAFTATVETAPGSSGGPVFDGSGNIIAIVVGGASDQALQISILLPL